MNKYGWVENRLETLKTGVREANQTLVQQSNECKFDENGKGADFDLDGKCWLSHV